MRSPCCRSSSSANSRLLTSAFIAIFGGLFLPAVPAQATVVTFDASAANAGGNGPVDAEATITTQTNAIDISLTNLEANLVSAGEEVSGVILTLSVKPTSVSIASSSGTLIDAPSTTPLGGSIADHWGVGASNFTVTLETAGPDAAGGKPFDLIIGPGVGDINSSVTQHEPEIEGTGVFDLAAAGVTSSTTVTGVEFLFGTTPDAEIAGVDPPSPAVPEPSALALLATALLGFGLYWRRAT